MNDNKAFLTLILGGLLVVMIGAIASKYLDVIQSNQKEGERITALEKRVAALEAQKGVEK